MHQTVPVLSRLIFTLAAVSVVVIVNWPVQGDQVSADAVRCELDPPRDIAGLEACVARFPRDLDLLIELGAAYEAAGRADDARTAYGRAIEVDPRDTDAQRRLAGLAR